MPPEMVKVIVVDDDRESAEALTQLLTLDGYSVWTASGGAEALALVEREHPLCVLLDLIMPEMAGAELARHLRAQHGTELVLVALTGMDNFSAIEQAELAGIDCVLTKPIDLFRLRSILPPIGRQRSAPA